MYNQAVFQMMAFYPTLYRTELKAQMALFLTTSNVEVDADGNIVRRESPYGVSRIQDRSKESILGDPPKPKDTRLLEDHNWTKFDDGRDCMFYPIGDGDLVLWEDDWREGKEFYNNDIFNRILRGNINLPEDWKHHISMFCYYVEHVDDLAYKAYLLAYIRTTYGRTEDQHLWYGRYWEGFVRLREVTPRIRAFLHPELEAANKEPKIDYAKLSREQYQAHAAEIISTLPEPRLSTSCLTS